MEKFKPNGCSMILNYSDKDTKSPVTPGGLPVISMIGDVISPQGVTGIVMVLNSVMIAAAGALHQDF